MSESRYEHMQYRRCGRSGLKLPAITFGLWQGHGEDRPFETSRAIVGRAFDLGVTHFDLANNYGPPRAPPRRRSGGSCGPTSGLTGTNSSSRQRPATTCGAARTVNGAPAST